MSAKLKIREHGCRHYYILFCSEQQSKQLHSQHCVLAVHVCSGKIHFYYLQKFNLETCSENPEVDMMPSLVSEAQVIQ